MATPPPPPLPTKLVVKKKPITSDESQGNNNLKEALSGVQRTSKAVTKGAHYFTPKSPSGFVGLSNQGK